MTSPKTRRGKRPRYKLSSGMIGRVLKLLEDAPESSAFNLMAAMNLSYSTICDKIRPLRKSKAIHISAWCEGADFSIYARYSAGGAEDAANPYANEKTTKKTAPGPTRDIIRRDSLVSALFGAIDPHPESFTRRRIYSKN